MKAYRKYLGAAVCIGCLITGVPGAAAEEPAQEAEMVTEGTAAEFEEENVTEQIAAEETAEEEKQEVTLHGLRYAKDYKEVYDALKSAWNNYWVYDDVLDYAVEDAEEAAPMQEAKTSAENSSADVGTAFTTGATEETLDFSQTNLREFGVDEADIVKTDGQWIYILRDGTELVIVKADGPDLSLASVTKVGTEGSVLTRQAADLYIDRDTLCIASQEYQRDVTSDDGWYYNRMEYTVLYTFDITDRENPVRIAQTRQDGNYKQSRKVDDVIYLYSCMYPNLTDEYKDSSIIPRVNGEEIPAEQVCIPNIITDCSYLIVSSVDLKDPGTCKDTKVLVSGAGECYVSRGSLYVMNDDYSGSYQRTEIVKFDCTDGKIEGRGACYLRGYVNDTFSIDEYNGNLRVLTTYTGSEYGAVMEAISDLLGIDYYDSQRWVRHNALYILDGDLKMLSSLKGIAEGEEIRSARYFGDTVYFVTFENTDPLFTADLSDPKHPELIGELKITGFSSYLHPYGEGKLLGIGYEADEDTGWETGLKLSMFDVSDPANVQEESRIVLKGITWCPAIEDYKAILVNADKNLIGFFCDNRYMVFSYDEKEGFTRELLYDFYEDMLSGASYDTMRGLYIGDELYLAGPEYVLAFNMGDGFTKENLLSMERS